MPAQLRFPALEPRIRRPQWGQTTLVLLLTLCVSWTWAQSTQQPTQMPYTAQVTGENVLVRSGPGTQQYQCGRLNRGDTVQVLGQQNGWARIVPPPGSFSWIAMQYVTVNLRDPSIGMVTGDGVRIYAGSDLVSPMHSTAKQSELKRGEKVKLMGEEKDGYFKIVPPKDAVLYVSSHYLESVTPASKPEVGIPAKPSVAVSEPNEPNQVAAAGGPNEPPSGFLRSFYALQDQVTAEAKKPLTEQDYTAIKKALKELPQGADPNKAARYTKFLLQRIEAYELVKQVNADLKQQDKQLQMANTRIDQARQAKLSEIGKNKIYTVLGTLKESAIFNEALSKRYRVVDDQGKTLCYAEATGNIANQDLSKFIGKKVGLVGTITAQPELASALVKFTQIDAVP